jgi:hypothetical protein
VASTQRIAVSNEVDACTGDHACLRSQIVEDHQRVGKNEQGVGHVDASRRRGGEAFDQPCDVVAEIADGAAPEFSDVGSVDRFGLAQERLEVGERIVRATRVVPPLRLTPVLDDTIDEAPRCAR